MNQTESIKEKVQVFLVILLPILVTQISISAMNFFDTTMSGHASASDLAGVAIGSNIWMPIFTGLNGILFAVTPIIAQCLGADRKKGISFIVMQAIYLAIAIGIIIIISGAVLLSPILNLMKLDETVSEVARQYLIAISFGVIPFFICTVLRCFIDSHSYTRITMLIMFLGLPINAFLNYILIFGKFGLPRLGGVGAGYATSITYWCIMLIFFCVINKLKPFKSYGIFKTFCNISWDACKSQLIIGLPIGFAIFCETSIFGAVTLLMSKFSTQTIAAHQAAINFASLIYMLPLSISMALTIAVGYEVGAQRFEDARQYCYLGIGIAVIMAVFFAIGLSIYNEQVARLYTDDISVLNLTQRFLQYAIFFQLSDAIAAPIQGALRGYMDVTVTFIMAVISYWVVGLPIGYIFANYSSFGAFGYWIGFISGLAIGAVCLLARLIYLQRKLDGKLITCDNCES